MAKPNWNELQIANIARNFKLFGEQFVKQLLICLVKAAKFLDELLNLELKIFCLG